MSGMGRCLSLQAKSGELLHDSIQPPIPRGGGAEPPAEVVVVALFKLGNWATSPVPTWGSSLQTQARQLLSGMAWSGPVN